MLPKDRNAYKNVLLRGLTSLLDPAKNKASSAAKPPAGTDAGATGPGAGASPAVAAVGPGAGAGPAAAAVAVSLQNAPLATAKHHATEGRKCLQKCAAPWLDVPSGSC